jgi:hypothetical protein
VEWVVREGVGAGGEMNQALYAHMNNKRKMKKKIVYEGSFFPTSLPVFVVVCVLDGSHSNRSGVESYFFSA